MESASLILLDTQVVIWLNQEREKISQPATEAISKARVEGSGLAISDFTLWEFAMLATRKRIRLEVPLSAGLAELCSFYRVLPMTGPIVEASMAFSPAFPGDPADRVIAATALIHHAPLVTPDRAILASGEVPCIW